VDGRAHQLVESFTGLEVEVVMLGAADEEPTSFEQSGDPCADAVEQPSELGGRRRRAVKPRPSSIEGVDAITHLLAHDPRTGEFTLRAMRLVYTTMLSLVLLLAMSFSLLKAFGVHLRLEPLLNGFVEPIGRNCPELVANVIDFVDNVNTDLLGLDWRNVAERLHQLLAVVPVHPVKRSVRDVLCIAPRRLVFDLFVFVQPDNGLREGIVVEPATLPTDASTPA
jgi:hypothetical protein